MTEYAKSIGVTDADAHTARNIHLSVADCKHLVKMLRAVDRYTMPHWQQAQQWSEALVDYLRTAV